MAFRPSKNNKNILSRIGRKSEGKMGVSDGCGGVYEAGEYGMERVSFHGDAGTETDVHDESYL